MVVITQKIKELFIKKGISPNKILVAPDGVDIEMFDVRCSTFEARERLGLPRDGKIVLYAGHLYKWKGVQTLAEASQYLPGNTETYFVGGTREDIKKFKIRNSKLKINVVGDKPHYEIPYWLKAADVLVLPNSGKEDISRVWTSPLKMFEYMASKRPIVASNLPSIQEILNGRNAVLVEPDSPEKLAAGIKEILENYQLAEKISADAFKDVQGYSWSKRVKNILWSFQKN